MSPAKAPSPTLPAKASPPRPEGHHTCRSCPACASETCRVLQELGMYCDTQCAASLASPAKSEAARTAA